MHKPKHLRYNKYKQTVFEMIDGKNLDVVTLQYCTILNPWKTEFSWNVEVFCPSRGISHQPAL